MPNRPASCTPVASVGSAVRPVSGMFTATIPSPMGRSSYGSMFFATARKMKPSPTRIMRPCCHVMLARPVDSKKSMNSANDGTVEEG